MRIATVLTFILVFALAGCVSAGAGLSEETKTQIPNGANAIRTTSTLAPVEYYDQLYTQLMREGFEIVRSDDERFSLSTAAKGVGQETTLALRLYVEEVEGGSQAVMRGRWGVTGSMAAGLGAAFGAGIDKDSGEPAVWKPRNRAGVAYGQMVQVAESLAHDTISYEEL